MKKYKILLVVILTATLFTFSNSFCNCGTQTEDQTSNKIKIPTITKEIKHLNMRMFGWQSEWFDSDDYYEYLSWSLYKVLHPELKDKRQNAFGFLKKQEKKRIKQKKIKAFTEKQNITTFKDLDYFCAPKRNQNYVAQFIDRTITELGTTTLYYHLANPITDVKTIAKRQEIIKTLIDNPKIIENLDKTFNNMLLPETVLLPLWNHESLKHSAKRCYFDMWGTKALNTSPTALLIGSISSNSKLLFSGGTYYITSLALVSFAILNLINSDSLGIPKNVNDCINNWVEKHASEAGIIFSYFTQAKNFLEEHSLSTLSSILAITGAYFCASQAKETFQWTHDRLFIEEIVHTLSIQITKYIRQAQNVYNVLKTNATLRHYKDFKGIIEFFEKDIKESELLTELTQLMESNSLKGQVSIWSLFAHKGKVLRTFKVIHKIQEKLEKMVEAIGRIDMYTSCAKLIQEYKTKQVQFCFSKFSANETPFVIANNFWHPLIDTEKVVANNITLGTQKNRPNMIITGPNEGGKSCVLKAITICLLMSQTLGIAPCKSINFTPFNSIATYLNITDNVNEENSSFKAEVLRAQGLIYKIQNSKPGEFNFTIFDEVFKGTEPLEGSAAAYSVAMHLGSFPNSISMIATHFDIMTNLEQETDTFVNYKVCVDQLKDGGLLYHYKLEPGKSTQNVALDILKNQGIAGSVIEKAQEIIARSH